MTPFICPHHRRYPNSEYDGCTCETAPAETPTTTGGNEDAVEIVTTDVIAEEDEQA